MSVNKLTVLLLILTGLYACLEPFNATVGNKASSYLVVEGLISNNNVAHTIKLTRSVANIDKKGKPVTGAFVVIEDDLGTNVVLTETDSGRYVTDTCNFRGVPGRTYTLYIRTNNGREYRSSPCLMKPSSRIDSIFFRPGNDYSYETTGQYNGVGLYVSGNANSDNINYLRWSYKEDWKFSVRFQPFEVPTPDGEWEAFSSNVYCWKSATSSDVMLYSFENQSGRSVIDKELYFIPAMESDRLGMRYSTLVEQYSISKEEYEFWRKMKQQSSGVGSIFGEQPFSIHGNIKNINDPSENVLGYFQVAGYASERLYIDYSDVAHYRIRVKDYFAGCMVDSMLLKELNKEALENGTPTYKNMYDLYDRLVLSDNSSYELAYIIFDETGLNALGLALSNLRCTDCTFSGEKEPPGFWEEKY